MAAVRSGLSFTGLRDDLAASYLKLKHDDWNVYARHLTDWERQTTFDSKVDVGSAFGAAGTARRVRALHSSYREYKNY